MQCIFCLARKGDAEFCEEHIFPDSIGGTLVIWSVCKACNSKLGHDVDVYLTDHFFVQGQRMLLNIQGKSGHVPNPLEHGTLVTDPGHKIISVLNDDGQPLELYTVPGIKRTRNPDGSETISIHIDKSEGEKLPGIVNKILKRAGRPPLSEAEIKANQMMQALPQPWVKVAAKIDLIHYRRAIAKIAYELACYWLGETYVNDSSAGVLRAWIFDNGNPDDWATKYKIHGTIGFINGATQYPFWEDESKSHLGLLMRSGNSICAYVRIFEVIEGTIGISEAPDLYPQFSAMFVAIDPRTGKKRESLLTEEITRIGQAHNSR